MGTDGWQGMGVRGNPALSDVVWFTLAISAAKLVSNTSAVKVGPRASAL